jgi:hypothetical protein
MHKGAERGGLRTEDIAAHEMPRSASGHDALGPPHADSSVRRVPPTAEGTDPAERGGRRRDMGGVRRLPRLGTLFGKADPRLGRSHDGRAAARAQPGLAALDATRVPRPFLERTADGTKRSVLTQAGRKSLTRVCSPIQPPRGRNEPLPKFRARRYGATPLRSRGGWYERSRAAGDEVSRREAVRSTARGRCAARPPHAGKGSVGGRAAACGVWVQRISASITVDRSSNDPV